MSKIVFVGFLHCYLLYSPFCSLCKEIIKHNPPLSGGIVLTSVSVEHLPKLCGVLNGRFVFSFFVIYLYQYWLENYSILWVIIQNIFFLFCSIYFNFVSWEIFQLALGLLDILPLYVCVSTFLLSDTAECSGLLRIAYSSSIIAISLRKLPLLIGNWY